jgi:hypothetical protein
VIAAQRAADLAEARVRELPAQVHRELARAQRRAPPRSAREVAAACAEELGDRVDHVVDRERGTGGPGDFSQCVFGERTVDRASQQRRARDELHQYPLEVAHAAVHGVDEQLETVIRQSEAAARGAVAQDVAA